MDYASGKSPRDIARQLNESDIPGPDGASWVDTTIRGQVERGTGILNNNLYIGQRTWNRTSYIKDPRTGKRVARVNPNEKWERVEVPDLRIIDQALRDRVRPRQGATKFTMTRNEAGLALNRAHRRQFLLSGLKDRLLAPELVERFTRELAEELAAAGREAAGARERLKAELAGVERRLQGVLGAIEDGAWNETLRTRLNELEARQETLKAELEAAGAPAPVIQLHPNAAAIYRDQVARLEEALNDPVIRLEASEALRALISRVVLTPDPDAPDGLRAELGKRPASPALRDVA